MADTYLEITQQIEALKQKAEAIRATEIAGVIDRIKAAIDAYGLTPEQLFETVPPVARRPRGTGKGGRAAAGGPRFRDSSGNTWSGRGPRPRWLKAALDAGKSLDDFRVGGATAEPARASKSPSGVNGAAKYRDDEGHSWSGRGPRPGWVKAALNAGKRLDELV